MRKCHVNLPDNFNQACYYYNHMVSDFILFTNMHSRYDLEAARENLTKQIARHEKEAGHGLDYWNPRKQQKQTPSSNSECSHKQRRPWRLVKYWFKLSRDQKPIRQSTKRTEIVWLKSHSGEWWGFAVPPRCKYKGKGEGKSKGKREDQAQRVASAQKGQANLIHEIIRDDDRIRRFISYPCSSLLRKLPVAMPGLITVKYSRMWHLAWSLKFSSEHNPTKKPRTTCREITKMHKHGRIWYPQSH